jgi:hypothetical protein
MNQQPENRTLLFQAGQGRAPTATSSPVGEGQRDGWANGCCVALGAAHALSEPLQCLAWEGSRVPCIAESPGGGEEGKPERPRTF